MGRSKKEQTDSVEMVEPAEAAETGDIAEIESGDDVPAEAAGGAFVVQWDIKVDGKRYAAGDTVNLGADDAARFLASGAVVEG